MREIPDTIVIPIDDEHAWAMLDRYAAGDLPVSDTAMLTAWIERNPEAAAVVQAMRAARVVPDGDAVAFDLEKVWGRCASQTETTGDRARQPSVTGESKGGAFSGRKAALGKQTLPWHLPSGIARIPMSFTIFIVALAVFFWRRDDLWRHNGSARNTYVTGSGQRTTVRLGDGSRVTLAPFTKIVVDANGMVLDGHAFFAIVHHPGSTFTVRTGAMTTTVLGTAFDVVYNRRTDETQVAVVEGKVATGGHRHVILSARMSARMTDSTVVVSAVPNVDDVMRWTEGRLVFHDAPVPDVLAALGQWYGYEFRISDSSLARRTITVTFAGQSSTQILTFIETMFDVSATFGGHDGRIVTLHPKHHEALDRMHFQQEAWPRAREVGR